MAQSEFGNVQLVALNIVDFKQLQKGAVEWEFDNDGHFNVIFVRDFIGKYFLMNFFK